MHEIYAAFGMIKIARLEGPRQRQEAEELFYAQACAPRVPSSVGAALRRTREKLKILKNYGQQARHCAGRNQAEAEGEDEVGVSCAGNGDSAGVVSGHHHERQPD